MKLINQLMNLAKGIMNLTNRRIKANDRVSVRGSRYHYLVHSVVGDKVVVKDAYRRFLMTYDIKEVKKCV